MRTKGSRNKPKPCAWRCYRKCPWNGKLWDRGDIYVQKPGEPAPPSHFEVTKLTSSMIEPDSEE